MFQCRKLNKQEGKNTMGDYYFSGTLTAFASGWCEGSHPQANYLNCFDAHSDQDQACLFHLLNFQNLFCVFPSLRLILVKF